MLALGLNIRAPQYTCKGHSSSIEPLLRTKRLASLMNALREGDSLALCFVCPGMMSLDTNFLRDVNFALAVSLDSRLNSILT